MHIQILSEDKSVLAECHVMSESIHYDERLRTLVIYNTGHQMEFGAVTVSRILDGAIELNGLERATSGSGFAPLNRIIRITFL